MATWPGYAFGLLLVLAACGLTRPLQPIDETRYAAVAWEMWVRGDLMLPVLNGQPYAHKPPLLFWTIHAGWALFGVQEWWLRALSPLFAAGTLGLMACLARRLWPAWPGVGPAAGCVLMASSLYAYFATALMFDALLGFFVTLGWLGLVRAAQEDRAGIGLGLLACGMAGGLLCKGPAALVHLLPLALAAPWWVRDGARNWRRWYAGVALATAVSALPVLAWAVQAGQAGGQAYRDAIFWRQTAGRMVDSFAHQAPAWLYVALLPPVLLPWLAWPRWWRGLLPAWRQDAATRFLIVGMLLPLIGFSLVSGKRVHYLLPEFVLFSLVVASGLQRSEAGRWSLGFPAASVVAAGLVLMFVAPGMAGSFGAPYTTRGLLPGGLALVAFGLALLPWRPATPLGEVRLLATATVAALVTLSAVMGIVLHDAHDLQVTARRLAELEQTGRPAAFVGKYHGQWTFAGRLSRPLAEVQPQDLAAWLEAHPGGSALMVTRRPGDWPAGTRLVDLRRYRGAWLAELVQAEPPLSALKPPQAMPISIRFPDSMT